MSNIYTHDEAAMILELFEEVLDRYDITVPSDEDDERDPDNSARLYGSTYSDLLDEIEGALISMLNRRREGADVVEWEFSGRV